MNRWLISVFLLACLTFQGAGLAALWEIAASHGGHAHLSLHQHDKAHHHLDDGTQETHVVVDNSVDSLSHLASDGTLSSPALLAGAPLLAPPPATASPPPWLQPLPPSPHPQGLQRPPRFFL